MIRYTKATITRLNNQPATRGMLARLPGYQRDQVARAIDTGGIAAGRSVLLRLDEQRRFHNRTMALRHSGRQKHNAEDEDEADIWELWRRYKAGER